ncbi:MAG TPA: hypothetical protein VIM41_00950 [Gammaproteobacteria bacterium]
MSITLFAFVSALLNLLILSVTYAFLAMRRENGKSDIRRSRVMLVISGFAAPIFSTLLFVAGAVIAQYFLHVPLPVGRRGGGVFIILIASVAAAMLTLAILLPRIKHRWEN